MRYTLIYLLLSVMFCMTSCDKFDGINTNPDAPNSVTPEMLALGGIKSILSNSSGKNFLRCSMACKHIAWGGLAEDYVYNAWGRTSLADYHTIINMQKMVDLASEEDYAAYFGLAKFVKAYTLFLVFNGIRRYSV